MWDPGAMKDRKIVDVDEVLKILMVEEPLRQCYDSLGFHVVLEESVPLGCQKVQRSFVRGSTCAPNRMNPRTFLS